MAKDSAEITPDDLLKEIKTVLKVVEYAFENSLRISSQITDKVPFNLEFRLKNVEDSLENINRNVNSVYDRISSVLERLEQLRQKIDGMG